LAWCFLTKSYVWAATLSLPEKAVAQPQKHPFLY
jgi:hypothetical protein